ncbi:glutathione binding-like protein [Burkholderia pseudomallei]|uniref:glutathione binding-like protein n=1 Tax=Burkholderia pseudomallei TaxID=28450 RepID=UPI0040643BD5
MRRNSRKVAIVPPRARRAVEPALGRRRGGCAARTARNPQEDVAIAQGRSVRRAPAPLRACAVVGERVGQRRAQMRVDGTLIPAHGTPARYEVIEWLTFVSSELHKTYSPWLFHADTADSTRRQCLEKLDRRLQEVDAHLATRDYLTGAFTVADAYLFAVANWSNFLRIPLAPYPHLVAFMARVGARAKVGEALAAEGLGR